LLVVVLKKVVVVGLGALEVDSILGVGVGIIKTLFTGSLGIMLKVAGFLFLLTEHKAS
jgi:hypothetical protein